MGSRMRKVFWRGALPKGRQGDAVWVPGLVPEFGVAGTTTGHVATFVETVGVRVGGQGDALQPESFADCLVVGQVEDVLDASEIGEHGQVGLTKPELVVLHGFGVTGDESLGVGDERCDAATHAAELGFALVGRSS